MTDGWRNVLPRGSMQIFGMDTSGLDYVIGDYGDGYEAGAPGPKGVHFVVKVRPDGTLTAPIFEGANGECNRFIRINRFLAAVEAVASIDRQDLERIDSGDLHELIRVCLTVASGARTIIYDRTGDEQMESGT